VTMSSTGPEHDSPKKVWWLAIIIKAPSSFQLDRGRLGLPGGSAPSQLKHSYLYWLWFSVEVIGRSRLVGQKVNSNQTCSAMQGG
jgi:hypothetical protein